MQMLIISLNSEFGEIIVNRVYIDCNGINQIKENPFHLRDYNYTPRHSCTDRSVDIMYCIGYSDNWLLRNCNRFLCKTIIQELSTKLQIMRL